MNGPRLYFAGVGGGSVTALLAVVVYILVFALGAYDKSSTVLAYEPSLDRWAVPALLALMLGAWRRAAGALALRGNPAALRQQGEDGADRSHLRLAGADAIRLEPSKGERVAELDIDSHGDSDVRGSLGSFGGNGCGWGLLLSGGGLARGSRGSGGSLAGANGRFTDSSVTSDNRYSDKYRKPRRARHSTPHGLEPHLTTSSRIRYSLLFLPDSEYSSCCARDSL